MTLAALEQVTGAIKKVTLVAVREQHITGRCGVGKCRQLCSEVYLAGKELQGVSWIWCQGNFPYTGDRFEHVPRWAESSRKKSLCPWLWESCWMVHGFLEGDQVWDYRLHCLERTALPLTLEPLSASQLSYPAKWAVNGFQVPLTGERESASDGADT